MKRAYQQITLVYDLRNLEMSEEQQREWITLVAEAAQKKLKSISGTLVHRVIDVQVGSCEIEEIQA